MLVENLTQLSFLHSSQSRALDRNSLMISGRGGITESLSSDAHHLPAWAGKKIVRGCLTLPACSPHYWEKSTLPFHCHSPLWHREKRRRDRWEGDIWYDDLCLTLHSPCALIADCLDCVEQTCDMGMCVSSEFDIVSTCAYIWIFNLIRRVPLFTIYTITYLSHTLIQSDLHLCHSYNQAVAV